MTAMSKNEARLDLRHCDGSKLTLVAISSAGASAATFTSSFEGSASAGAALGAADLVSSMTDIVG